MRGDESAGSHESLWKGQEGERMRMTTEEVCLRARSFEKKSVREYWLVLGLLALFTARAAMCVVKFSEPLIRMGFAFGVATFLYIALRWARNGPPRRLRAMSETEPCVDFLRCELERKRQRLLEIRMTLLLLFPSIFASWLGGGPVG
jgi:hypothetical protein